MNQNSSNKKGNEEWGTKENVLYILYAIVFIGLFFLVPIVWGPFERETVDTIIIALIVIGVICVCRKANRERKEKVKKTIRVIESARANGDTSLEDFCIKELKGQLGINDKDPTAKDNEP